METAVDKLEAMFQKTEADMEYIEKRLRLDFLTSALENGTVEENPVKLLENLSAVKARHAALCAQVQEIEAEQKQSMDSIRAHLGTTLQLVQHLQQAAGQEAPQLTEAEQLSTEFLGLTVKGDSAEVKGTLLAWGLYDKSRLGVNKVPVSTEVQAQEQPQSSSEFEEISEAALDGVPRSVRSNVKLAGLNTFYKQLQEHFSNRTNSGPLSLQKMKQLNMKVSEAKLKILEHLGLINLDKKGHVRLL